MGLLIIVKDAEMNMDSACSTKELQRSEARKIGSGDFPVLSECINNFGPDSFSSSVT
ncbi:hypothetical protein HanPSC8_Chr13g0547541 [Helianthus annuus]|nr:hypothetical protein HanPSC8_Chr13g0547541 [Helianthus annuus]